MLSRRNVIAAVAVFSLAPSVALALHGKPFNQATFEAAQAAGKPILIDVSAPWCPTCRTQAPILLRLVGNGAFKDVVWFNVDFDTQKDLLRKLNVRSQSTLIVYKGKQEVGRSTGDTNEDSIKALIAKSI